MSRLREPAGRSRETFWRPLVPSGKEKVRSFVAIEGEGIVGSGFRETGIAKGRVDLLANVVSPFMLLVLLPSLVEICLSAYRKILAPMTVQNVGIMAG